MILNATDPRLLFSKNDANDVRLGDLAEVNPSLQTLKDLEPALEKIEVESNAVVILGYPDDDGIAANGGRVGAKEAPDRIRNFFYRMTPPAFQVAAKPPGIHDLGNLDLTVALPKRHEYARSVNLKAHQFKLRTLTFGGGHDYGFPDAAAYCEAAKSRGERPLVINFDAHLDVRPMDHGITSGTPFFRMLTEFPDVDFIELGLQSQCNSRSHVQWLTSRGGLISFEEERLASRLTLAEQLMKLLGDRALARRSAFLSVDIDAFSSAVAPGASQSWPTGFQPAEFLECFSWCLNRFDVRGVGIYEVSPRLDVDDRTSRLAALIAHRFVFQL